MLKLMDGMKQTSLKSLEDSSRMMPENGISITGTGFSIGMITGTKDIALYPSL